jgi:hypothetical protein
MYLNVKVGQEWKCNDDKIFKIEDIHCTIHGISYPYKGCNTDLDGYTRTRTWTQDGCYMMSGRYGKADLKELIFDPEIGLRVGDTWKDHNGVLHKIRRLSPYPDLQYPVECDSGSRFTLGGRFVASRPSSDDLLHRVHAYTECRATSLPDDDKTYIARRDGGDYMVNQCLVPNDVVHLVKLMNGEPRVPCIKALRSAARPPMQLKDARALHDAIVDSTKKESERSYVLGVGVSF